MDGELRRFAESYTAAWRSRDPDRVAAHFEPQGSLRINGGAPARGRAAIGETARSFMAAFPDLVVTLDRLAAAADRVEYHWTLTGANNGPGGTGRRVSLSGCETWTLGESGLIAFSEGRFDQAEYARQLGAGTAEPVR